MIEQIDNLDSVLHLDENKTVQNYTIHRLTTPGENYGSLIIGLDVVLETPEGTEEIHTVVKLVPPNEFLQEIFNTQVTFKNEISFYKDIFPTLRKFQQENGVTELINFAPNYYGSRINQNGTETVDTDALILLENLKYQNFTNVDRRVGFDLETSKLILEDLAQLHAVPLALKLQKPDVFESEIKKYLLVNPRARNPPVELYVDAINKIDALRIYKTRTQKALQLNEEKEPREPYGTISHNDCWVNNFLIQFEKGRAVDSKILDFQTYSYGSPGKDLVFFLFSSVQKNVLEKNYDLLVRHYHGKFTKTLKELDCDVSRFSWSSLLREINFEATNSQFSHLVYMSFIIFKEKESVVDVTELTRDNILQFNGQIADDHKEKLVFLVKEFSKRNWI